MVEPYAQDASFADFFLILQMLMMTMRLILGMVKRAAFPDLGSGETSHLLLFLPVRRSRLGRARLDARLRHLLLPWATASSQR